MDKLFDFKFDHLSTKTVIKLITKTVIKVLRAILVALMTIGGFVTVLKMGGDDVLLWLFVLVLFSACGFGIWTVNKEIRSQTNAKSSSPDFGDQVTSSPDISDEALHESTENKIFRGLLIFFSILITSAVAINALKTLLEE